MLESYSFNNQSSALPALCVGKPLVIHPTNKQWREKSFHVIVMTSHERHVVSNHRLFDYLFNSLCGPTSKKHQSLHYWPFVRGIHRWPVNSPRKGPVTRKNLLFDDVIMSLHHYVTVEHFTRTKLMPEQSARYFANNLFQKHCLGYTILNIK